MKKKLLALLMGTSLVLAACGGGGDDQADQATGGAGEDTTASAGDAEKLYNNKCSSCHGADLSGGIGPGLANVGASLSKEDIESIIVNGQGAMPKGLLQGEDASVVAEWLAGKK